MHLLYYWIVLFNHSCHGFFS